MSDHVYKTIEVTGSSATSIEDAINGAIKRSGESVNNLRWFTAEEIRGHISEGEVEYYQVTVNAGGVPGLSSYGDDCRHSLRRYFLIACAAAVKPKQAVTATNEPMPVAQSSVARAGVFGLA